MKYQTIIEGTPYLSDPSPHRQARIKSLFDDATESRPSSYRVIFFTEDPLPGGAVRPVLLIEYGDANANDTTHRNVVYHATTALDSLGIYAVRAIVQEVVSEVASGALAGAAVGLGASLTPGHRDDVHLIAAALGAVIGGAVGNLITRQKPILVANRVLGPWEFERALEGVLAGAA